MLKLRRFPLCVDCDGTLIATDLLHEAVLLLVKASPLSILLLPFWLLRGKAYLKEQLAARVRFDVSSLPYNQPVLDLIQAARAEGRSVVLATASPRAWADGIAAHLGVFDQVLATEHGQNLSGADKGEALTKLCGDNGFDYVGNSRADLPVWKMARQAVVVSSSSSLASAARAATELNRVIPVAPAGALAYLKMLRVHQWLKNLLIAVPMLAAHQFTSSAALLQTALAFVAFSLCASAVYLMNDLLDLEADRQHIRKRHRPLAAGRIPVSHAIGLAPVLLIASAAIALAISPAFLGVLSVYLAVTLAYSLRLKRQVVVDVMVLAGLYTLRIVAGAAATHVTPSFWLLAFSMFLFLSLAIVKRYSEMQVTLSQNKSSAAGRGYRVADMPVLLSLGAAAGMASVMVISLYIGDADTRKLYPSTTFLWVVPTLILYWISRVWMKTHRGEIHDDPVVFAIRDWQSLATLAIAGSCFAIARLA